MATKNLLLDDDASSPTSSKRMRRSMMDDLVQNNLMALVAEHNPFSASWGEHMTKWQEVLCRHFIYISIHALFTAQIFDGINSTNPGAFADVAKMRDTVNSRLRRLLNKCKAHSDVASELEREQGPIVEALKLFRAEIEKRKDKRRVNKLKAAMDGDISTFRRLSAQGGTYRCVQFHPRIAATQPTFNSDNEADDEIMMGSNPEHADDEQQIHHHHDESVVSHSEFAAASGPADPPPDMPTELPEIVSSPAFLSLLKKAKEEDLELFMKFLTYRQKSEAIMLEKQVRKSGDWPSTLTPCSVCPAPQ